MSASVFPARAGMSRFTAELTEVHVSVPRASGDEPNPEELGPDSEVCSPRERG